MGTNSTATMNRASSVSICQTLHGQSEMKQLLWLAEAIVDDVLIAESCVAAAMLRADGSAYVAPDWRDLWIRRCVVRDAVERNSAEIKRLAANYMRDAICKRLPNSGAWDTQAIGSLTAIKINESLNVFERAALILHAYLGFSTHDCALLTDCHWSLIEPACSNAVARLFQERINARES
jgi:DNA-directed RNA polymerase specialized sigma24 family protein